MDQYVYFDGSNFYSEYPGATDRQGMAVPLPKFRFQEG